MATIAAERFEPELLCQFNEVLDKYPDIACICAIPPSLALFVRSTYWQPGTDGLSRDIDVHGLIHLKGIEKIPRSLTGNLRESEILMCSA